jgi:Family of unknown function (DUF6958)
VGGAGLRLLDQAHRRTQILPKTSPELTVEEVQERVIAHLPEDLFPGGAKAGWWAKTMEAKGTIERAKTKPLRLRKA